VVRPEICATVAKLNKSFVKLHPIVAAILSTVDVTFYPCYTSFFNSAVKPVCPTWSKIICTDVYLHCGKKTPGFPAFVKCWKDFFCKLRHAWSEYQYCSSRFLTYCCVDFYCSILGNRECCVVAWRRCT